MKSIEDFLFDLKKNNIEVWGDGEKLRFKAPSGALTSDLKDQLRQRKEEIIDFLQRQMMLEQPIPRLPEGAVAKASIAQQRLIFLEAWEDNHAVYNIPAVFQCDGHLDADGLAQSLIALVTRHESLRTCFPRLGEEVVAKVLPPYNPLQVTDLRGLPDAEQKSQIDRLVSAHAKAPFDLEHGPLFSLHLLQLRQDRQILSFNIHHIISDGWSVGVMIREWRELYHALIEGREAHLPILPIQFNDYAAWQRQWLEQGVTASQLAYWKKQLEGLPDLLALPTDFPRPSVMTVKGRHFHAQLPLALSEQVRKISHEQGCTVFMTLLAVFNVLMHRWSGQDDLAVGSPIANRTHPHTEHLIGFFVNTLVLRSRAQKNQNFLEILDQVRQTALAAYAHQDLPFDYLVEKLNPARSLGHSPLFQVMFALQNAHQEKLSLASAELTLLKPDYDIAKFDLSLSIETHEACLLCDWEYRSDLFSADTIKRMAEHFQLLLERVLAFPDRSVDHIPMVTEAEQHRLITWGHRPLEIPQGWTVVDLFEHQAEKYPERCALVSGGQSLSYATLNARANQIARRLTQLGAGSEKLVGLCLERSPDMIIGLLGILKSGSAYLPLDPAYPKERLQFMVHDAGLDIVVTQTRQVAQLPERASLSICCVDAEDWTVELGHNMNRRSAPSQLAYVIYTSGSTGQPKGVMIEHAALANYVQGAVCQYQFTADDRVLQFSSINFDASAEEIFTTLTAGACLVLRDADMLASEQDFLQACEVLNITVFPGPTAYWHQLVSSQAPWPASLRLVIIGGEAVSLRHVQRWQQERPSHAQLVNTYGPTETTIVTTAHWVGAEERSVCPIGQPIPNARIYLLDAHRNPVPPGVAGELCIAGVGLARGYLNRPETTAEKFVNVSLFGREERIYCSGDLARWLPDGNLEYLGRLDHQVKLRGFRIELGEIENALVNHDTVSEAVVILRERAGEPYLAAYVTTQGVSPNLSAVLRTFLSQSLPQWMVPASITLLDQLPLNPNGKVDRKALPEPELTVSADAQAPATEIEKWLCEVWSQTLKRPMPDVRANFFEVGGHSLLATQLVTRIRSNFGVAMPLRMVFERPRLIDQARWLAQQRRGSCLPSIEPQVWQDVRPLSLAQQRLWFLSQMEGPSTVYNIPAIFKINGVLNVPALKQALVGLITRHEMLRARFVSHDGHAVLELGAVDEPLETTDLRTWPAEEQTQQLAALSKHHANHVFDLRHGPLLKLHLVQLAEDDYRLLCNMHHIISDGWSVGILLREWSESYRALCQGQSVILPALPIQYSDYAAWQQKWVTHGPSMAYWKAQLANLPELLELPTDFPRPAVNSHRGGHVHTELPADLVKSLQRLSLEQGGTLFMTLLAAFNVLLHRYSGQRDLAIGTPIANRTEPGTEHLIGCFVNTLVLRTQLDGSLTFTDLLAQVRRTALDGYSHQEVAFDHLVEQINPTRSLSHSPLFQVMFALQNAPDAQLALGTADVKFVATDNWTSKFDLTLNVAEQAGTLVCHWEYSSDLFLPQTIERMAARFQVLLAGVVQQPQQPIHQLPLSTPTDQAQWITWNQTQRSFSPDQTLVDLLEAQVARTPHAIAVDFEGQTLTYRQLNQFANQWAQRLIAKGVQAETLVGICMTRSLEMVVGLLAILKAGGAYVPLDPNYPAARLVAILEDSRVTVLLTQTRLHDVLPLAGLPTQPNVVTLDAVDGAADGPFNNFPRRSQPHHLAYVLFTSGSTGRPKGVAIEHASAHGLICWAHEVFSADVLRGTLASTSINFDLSVYELFVPLSVGGTVFLAENALHLATLRHRDAVTLINTVPSAIAELLRSGDIPPSVKVINLAGEALQQPLVAALYALPHIEAIYNLYGPSEDTTYSTFTRLPRDITTQPRIGKPLANTRVYILDEHLQPVPSDIPGELCIAGEGLARGYLNRADLTAEKFVHIELMGRKERIYRTGDLARWCADGELEYRGRIDHQIKLRGFRIELGEIEAVLSQHPDLDAAAVVVHEHEGNRSLAAYVSPRTASATRVSPESLRTWLSDKLPDYMVPSFFTVLAHLPLTPNGKIDRRALPQPDRQGPTSAIAQPLRTPSEHVIASLWAQVLKFNAQELGADSNFFALGGHSLLATQLAARVREAFAVEMPLRVVFSEPTVAGLAAWLDRQQRGSSEPVVIQPLAHGDMPPLSFAQQRLWFLDQLEGASAHYNMPVALRLRGVLNVAVLRQAFQGLVMRHAGLRQHFPVIHGTAEVRMLPGYDPLVVTDLRHLAAPAQTAHVQRLADEDAHTPFDLATGPLLRAHLLVLGSTESVSPADEHVLLINMHHIISDGASIAVLLRDWKTLYQVGLEGGQANLPALPLQYGDYAAWQRQWLQGETLARQSRYWQQKLAHLPALLEMPTDWPRPAVQDTRGATFSFSLDATLTRSLQNLAQAQGCTLFMVLLSAFQTLLHRYTRQDDVCVGSPVANRTHAQTEGMVGFFVNTLVLRAQFEPRMTFAQLLQQVRQTALEAYAHQDIPFEQLVETLHPERSRSHSPLFQVMFVLQNNDVETLELPGLSVEPLAVEQTTAKFDLTLSAHETPDGLICHWEYATALFHETTVARFAEQWGVLLRGIVAHPDQPIAALPLLTQAEQQQLLRWNDTQHAYPHTATLVDLFESQARQHPDRLAVVFENTRLTYAELRAQAHQLAHALIEKGVQSENRVGLCVERSVEMLVGILAILKAGGAYVPLDPSLPADRLAFMLEDAQPAVVLTQTHLQERVQTWLGAAAPVVLCLDGEDWAHCSRSEPAVLHRPDQLAYVMYTSGSTGRPKGVEIEHRNVIAFLFAYHKISPLQETMASCSVAPFGFDPSVWEFFFSLCSGHSLHVIPTSMTMNPDRLVAYIQAHHIAMAYFPPSILEAVISRFEQGGGFPLKTILVGVESILESVLQRFRNLSPEVFIINGYGPTETTICATFHAFEHDSLTGRNTPIGRPLSGYRVHVLDDQQQPVPIGARGELCVAGAGVGRGYWRRPDLSAEKFITVSLHGQPERIYRTGDLARWLPDGHLEYLGRVDHQVKLRGFRIELGEIESVLRHDAAVQEAVVALVRPAGVPLLVAYLTLNVPESDVVTRLREHLRQVLPDYMVPSRFVVLPEFPLMPSGKIDRRALPVPDLGSHAAQQLPRTATEHMLCVLWSNVLKTDVQHTTLSFFEAGGHSLSAVQLAFRIRDTWGVDMPLSVVFETPVLAEQAAWIDRQQRGSDAAIVPQPGAAPVLSFAQQRLWFLAQMEEQNAAYNMPAALRLSGTLDVSALQSALAALIERHESLRVCFPAVDGEPVVQALAPYSPLVCTDLSGLPEAAQARQLQHTLHAHVQTPFDLGTGPLLKLHLVKLAAQTHVLLFNMHHIVSDGWSVGVLLHEWGALYNALTEQQAPALPALPIQYSDYAAWQRQWLAQGAQATQLAYWQRQLAGLPELLALPTDFPRPDVPSYRGGWVRTTLRAELAQAVQQLGRAQGTTLFMTLLAAFKVMLHRWSGQVDMAVGSPVAGRTHRDTEHLIGFFVNTLVLRSQVQPHTPFTTLLQQVRQTALVAYNHQDIPFEHLVMALNPERSMSHAPLFQVMLAVQNAPMAPLTLKGLSVSPLDAASPTSKFDLFLSVAEDEGTLQCHWEFSTDLFRPATIEAMAARFEVLLASIVAQPDAALHALSWLRPEETAQLRAWNDTAVSRPHAGHTVVDLVAAQVARTPAAVAVEFEGASLRYAELNERAEHVAQHLLAQGVAPASLVGLCVPRSLAMAVGVLGILKAGAAYVPLDPDYPQERLDHMLADSGVRVVLSHSTLRHRWVGDTGTVLEVDTLPAPSAPAATVCTPPQPEQPAYVLYTSGSTGRPKGVLMPHRALHNLMHWHQHQPRLGLPARCLQFAPLNFDVSFQEMFSTWATGGTLVLIDNTTRRDPSALVAFLAQHRVERLFLPFVALDHLAHAALEEGHALALRDVITAGEALRITPALRRFFTAQPDCALHNHYGPTEAHVVTTLQLPSDPAQWPERPSIGSAVGNVRLYIVDAALQPVPPGVPGELCIAGVALADGYLNQPELTQEKFVTLSWHEVSERVYRTGDSARWLTDGTIECLGRIDHQVKVRGFRVELGEIEAVLARHADVREVAVVQDGQRLLAYLSLHQPQPNMAAVLRTALSQQLPEYMVPAAFIFLDALPLNPNGKIDRRALPAPASVSAAVPSSGPTRGSSAHHLEAELEAIWRAVLNLDHVGRQDNFFDLGGHSLLLIQVQSRLKALTGRKIALVKLFQYPTIQALAAHLSGDETAGASAPTPAPQASTAPTAEASSDIAIIGMAGYFPGADDVDTFWRNLRDGVESIQFFSDEALIRCGVDPAQLARPDYVKAGTVLERAEYFDARFFGYSPKEAEIIDPQQRLFLETAWAGMEHAGYDVTRLKVPVGVFAGVAVNSYLIHNLLPNRALVDSVGGFQLMLSSDKDYVATRTAYKLQLEGPAMAVQTACSTSLVAVHMACQSLLRHECDMALAGGAALSVPQGQGYVYQEGMIMSPDGHCRAFDARAKGTVGGRGAAVVVLKRLAQALADGDTIHAVIKATAINNDGARKVGFTAPSVAGQAAVIQQAMRGLDYEAIGYVEAHGTGTVLGDPIEVEALTQAYRAHTQKTGYCALGSLKTNVGHMDSAAGVAGLIKTVMAMKHRQIPPSLHFEQPNPQIDFEHSPFFVNAQLRPWDGPAPRRAGVSSFGIGGTNAHAVLEEAPTPVPRTEGDDWHILCVSAKTPSALARYRQTLGTHLAEHPALSWADVAFTFNTGRSAWDQRAFVVGRTLGEAAAVLTVADDPGWVSASVADTTPQVVFMFPGQGAQYLGMAQGLYQREPVFRRWMDACAPSLQTLLGWDVRELLYGDTDTSALLVQTQCAQPVLFAIEYSLAQLFIAWGVQPAAMIGHSLGEYVAACLAGVMSLDDALKLVALRGQWMQRQPTGAMLSVPLSEAELLPWLGEGLALAAHNAPQLCVASGEETAIEALAQRLHARQVECRRLQTSHAFHSPMMAAAVPAFRQVLQTVSLKPPRQPFLSNVTGTWIRDEEATSVDYWARHLTEPVRFSESVQTLWAESAQAPWVFLELGPGRTLSTLVRQHVPAAVAINALRPMSTDQDDRAFLLKALGQLWLHRVPLDWAAVFAAQPVRRIPLPTYPFERQRCWVEAVPVAAASPAVVVPLADITSQNETVEPTPSQEDPAAPRTAVEQQLAAIWQELLGVTGVRRHDDFFELGGHSLLGTQLLSRVRERLALEIQLDDIFRHPVLADLATCLTARQAPATVATAADAPQAALVETAAVLSFSQQRLWFLAQMEEQNAAYNMPAAIRLRGHLDEAVLRQALWQLTQRQQSLRLCFPAIDGAPTVRINPPYDPLHVTDLQTLPADEQRATLHTLIEQHAQALFDLAQGPLLKLHLLKMGPDEQVLLFNMHHIISDGWSMGVLMREWGALYNALSQQQTPDLPALPTTYSEYATWQRQGLEQGQLATQLAYWQRQLAGIPERLELPTDRPRPANMSYRGAQWRGVFDAQLTQAMQQFGREQGATLFMTLLAAFSTVLHRWSGQEDIVVGSPVANRQQREVEGLIGFFVNTLVLRTRLHGAMRFADVLAQVRQTALEAYRHQDVPFEHLVSELNPVRSTSHSPLFQVMLAVQNAPGAPLSLNGLTLEVLPQSAGTAKFDLFLSAFEHQGQLVCDWEYSRDLFDEDTIARMAGHLETLLRACVQQPNTALAHVPWVTAAEHAQLQAWNRTQQPAPMPGTVVDRVQAQVRATPDQPAVCWAGQTLSYAQLNQQANVWAQRLMALGVAPGDKVGLCVERSLAMAVGVLAILKAGAAYVPLDPDYPQERLEYMLGNAAVPVLLTQTHLRARLPVGNTQVLHLDVNVDEATLSALSDPVPAVDLDHPAYVLYTSGSTGQPKGVVMPHRALVNLTDWHCQQPRLGQAARTLQFAPLSFDVSFQEMFSTWATGGTLILIDNDTRRDPPEWVKYLAEQAVTRLFVPFVALEHLAQAALASSHRLSLVDVVTAGEQLRITPALRRFFAAHPGCALHNHYGPTEAHVVTTLQLDGDPADWPDLPVIGHPIHNARVHIVDEEVQPLPVGVPGELCIAGDALAHGYLHRADLTAEKFIEVTLFGARERLYRTGDLARRRADGSLECLGRIDSQVKVRGFRVELSEIETVLHQHAAVSDAAVVLNDQRLIAYLTLSPPLADPAGTLRPWLKQRLPEYMLPAAFVVLDALPINPNGKVDRKALAAREVAEVGTLSADFVMPRTADERQLVDVWARVLKVAHVGMTDNFFDLGGHSLLATRLVAEIRQAFGVLVPLRELFASPQPDELLRKIVQLRQAETGAVVLDVPEVIADPAARHQPFPLTDIQHAYWMGRHDFFELGNMATHVYVELDCPGLDVPRLNAAWQRLIDRHEMLRMIVRPSGEQQILADVPPYRFEAYEVARLDEAERTRQLAAVRQEMSHQMRPADQWPLFDIRVSHLDTTGLVRLHFSFDALIADAWGMYTLFSEWETFYRQPDTVLPALDLSFRDYVMAEHRWQQTASYQHSLQYWLDKLDTLPPAPQLPLAKNPASLVNPRFKGRSVRIAPDQWQRLKQRAARADVTPSGMLLTAFADVLCLWSRQPRLTINLTLFNRQPVHPQVDDILGDFTSLTLLAVDNSVPDSFSGRARRLQQQLWQDLEHRAVSGVRVQQALARRQATGVGSGQTMMPVVFTSTLTLTQGQPAVAPSAEPIGQLAYSITQTPQVWLDHHIYEEGDGALTLNWDAIDELFPVGLLDDMFDAYSRHVLALASDDAAWQSPHTAHLLPAWQATLWQQFNATQVPFQEALLHDLFVTQAALQGERDAVITPSRRLSYAELFRFALRIGGELRRQGVRPNELVGVVMEKGWEPIAAVLGILLAGGAYLPIDPELPEKRRHHLLHHGEARWVLTQPRFAEALVWPSGVNCLVVDDALARLPLAYLPPAQQPTDLAYVIFTSGSTGQPKGVMIDHRGALNTIEDINRRFEITAQDRVLSLSALNFDLSVYDIFGILGAGGAIVMPDADMRRDPAHWIDLMHRHAVTVWNTVPALMQILVDAAEVSSVPSALRLCMMSGDWIPLPLPDRIRALWPDLQTISLGGATEVSIWSIFYPIDRVDPTWRSIPYGRPLDNQTLYVLNQALAPCPVWVPGRLYIGGIGLAHGYWRDEAKTAASFITHPHTGERLYSTGDLGRYLPDGQIEFMGREDFQVKIRGYRIELSEIEVVLGQHAAVKEAVLAVFQERLVAYVVLHQALETPSAVLSAWLADHLPAYMVPADFLVLETLPLTANGKVDRKSLPEPQRLGEHKTQQPPRDTLELQLAQIWENILGSPPACIRDDFFAAGGNSLLAVRLLSQIRQHMGRDLSIAALFQQPNIEALAVLLRQTTTPPAWSPLVSIQKGAPDRAPLFCVHPGGGTVMCYMPLAQHLGAQQPVYGLQALGTEPGQTPYTAIADMARLYIDAMRSVQPHGPYRLAGWSLGGWIAYEMACQLERQGDTVSLLAVFDTTAPGAVCHSQEQQDEIDFIVEILEGKVAIEAETLRRLSPEAQIRHIIAQGQAVGLFPPDMDPDHVRRLIRVFQAGIQAGETYRPTSPYSGPMVLFQAQEQPAVIDASAYTAWADHVPAGVVTEVIPGNHQTLVKPPHVQVLAQSLKTRLG